MDVDRARKRLIGCYVTVPTMFRDSDLELDVDAQRRAVRFLVDGGIKTGTGVLLAGGAAGEFSTMSVAERLKVTETVVDAAGGEVAVTMGAQTTNTRELVELARAAESVGAEFIQVSAPFYFSHTQDDFYEFVAAAAAATNAGVILYNTFWTSCGASMNLIDRFMTLPNFVGLKWAPPPGVVMGFERVVNRYARHLHIIDNDMRFVSSHILGARGIELHVCNYWPQWGVRLWQMLEAGQYVEVQHEMMRVATSFYQLWEQMEEYTGGDGYLDKLCIELVGLGSSRCRPPTRDVRQLFRDKARKMLLDCGVPNVVRE